MLCPDCEGYGGDPVMQQECSHCRGDGRINQQEPLTHCPICDQRVDSYDECDTATPYTATSPLDGLLAWGAASVPKRTVCYKGGRYIHFQTPGDGRPLERLVFMTLA